MDERWQIVSDYGDGFHAGPKAQRDVTEILHREGWCAFFVKRCVYGGLIGKLYNRLAWAVECQRLRVKLPENCTLFMQYPSAAWSKSRMLRIIDAKIKARKQIRLITLFHDIASLRWGMVPLESRQLSEEERTLMDLSDAIIIHNDSMKMALVARGVQLRKLIPLGAFDYLTPVPIGERRSARGRVAIAGNLDPDKAGYLESLAKILGVQWRLYGVQFDPKRVMGDNVEFCGCYPPEELPGKLDGSFGLVWDGPSAETCTGDMGGYLRINNPHKLSLYLASGLPVIIWSGAAEAEFVKQKGVGICVDALRDIPARLAAITQIQYGDMVAQVRSVAIEMRNGSFLKKAIAQAVQITQENGKCQ